MRNNGENLSTTAAASQKKCISCALFVSLFMTYSYIYQAIKTLSSISNSSKQLEAQVDSSAHYTSLCSGKVLDQLDEIFDKKRLERVTMMNTSLGDSLSFDIYEPEATCISEERFGSDRSTIRYNAFGDGPKFICGVDFIAQQTAHHGKNCLVYSVGSANRIGFERAVHTFMKGCEIHTFDPTLKSEFVGKEFSTFHPWGLGIDGVKGWGRGKSWEGKSFETVFKELAHENRTVDILKIDCEGCEYDVMPPLFEEMRSGRVKVDQILIELHLDKLNNNITKLKNFFWMADKAKMRLFHKERNGWGCQGKKCAEFAFASESFLREANGNTMCPQAPVERIH
jgi:hypothetical protein